MGDYRKYSDQELATAMREGNDAAFTEIYNRYYGLLYSHAYRKLQNREEVKDVLHELFAHIWNSREHQLYTSSLPAYLYTAIRNKILNVIRINKLKMGYQASIEGFIELDNNIADALVRENELIALIEKEIALLPPKMRQIFEMSRKEQLSHKEIAEKLKISPSTVKKQVNNALKILRIKLGSYIFSLFF